MTKISTKELIICIIAVLALVLALTTDAFASSIDDLAKDANNVNEFITIPEDKNIVKNNAVNNAVNKKVNNATKNNTNKNATTIPDAGLDQSIVFIIAIFGISAAYAYKKIKDYKNI